MTLAELTQFLGGIGVIASLIYVAIQIRNNARTVRAATYQQIGSTMTNHFDMVFASEELCSLVLRGCDDFVSLNRVEKARFRFYLMSVMHRFENAWFQHNIGTMQLGDWQAFAVNMDSLFSLPGTQTAWPLIKTRTNPEFRAFVDELAKRQAPLAAAYVPPAPIISQKPKGKRK